MKGQDIQIYFDARREVLINLRLDKGYTNMELYSEKVDITSRTYCTYESGVTIDEKNIFKILDFHNLTMLEFETRIHEVFVRRKIKKNQSVNLNSTITITTKINSNGTIK